jgi:tRNA pseudouridine55 synthase
VDKPGGWTSHDVVAVARRITGQRRIGHTGTLDPMATGLLVLCLGQATRLVEYLAGHDKRYTGEVVLGRTTSTDDAEGETLTEAAVPDIDQGMLRELEQRFAGEILQVPPAVSAVKVAGRRAYAVARAGGAPRLAPRRVVISRLELELRGPGRLGVDVHCSAGTYVRSLARDIGIFLGCGAHLGSLRRHRAGPFSADDAISLERLEDLRGSGAVESALWPPDEGMSDHDAAILGAEGAARFGHGLAHSARGGAQRAAATARVYSGSGAFLGVGQVSSSGEIRPVKVLSLPN